MRPEGVMRTTILGLLLLTSSAGCVNVLEPIGKRPANEQEIRWAASVYPLVADCLAMDNFHHEVRYWVVRSLRGGGENIRGGAHQRGDIYVVEDFYRPYTLRHEIMHHVLWRNTGDGDSNHRHPGWRECGDPRYG